MAAAAASMRLMGSSMRTTRRRMARRSIARRRNRELRSGRRPAALFAHGEDVPPAVGTAGGTGVVRRPGAAALGTGHQGGDGRREVRASSPLAREGGLLL